MCVHVCRASWSLVVQLCIWRQLKVTPSDCRIGQYLSLSYLSTSVLADHLCNNSCVVICTEEKVDTGQMDLPKEDIDSLEHKKLKFFRKRL